MRKADLEKFKDLLEKKRIDMLKEMGVISSTHGSSTIKESTGDLSHYSYHMADQGTDNMERELAFAYASKGGRFLHHIDEALLRIKDGTYGKCHSCGKNIQLNRLKAVPHARLCIQCKSEEEVKKTGRK
ncbi:MAG: TraR/DksA C4-type zinc finger protein [candidate division Zixibacteria bacterium]|nr:TraR/DksA C4-type zinc finger protein [candidate division Zixibacteria bacterium]